jgi:hypothetical protein
LVYNFGIGNDPNDNFRTYLKHEKKLQFQNIFLKKSGLNAQCGMYDIADIFINVQCPPTVFLGTVPLGAGLF